MSLLDLFYPKPAPARNARRVTLAAGEHSEETAAQQRLEALARARAAKAAKTPALSDAERRARELKRRRAWYARNRDKLRAAKRAQYHSRKSPPPITGDIEMTDMPADSLVDYLPIDALVPSQTNPRSVIGDVTELAETIGRMGVLQPLLVRPASTEGRYEVISGHRRLVAAGEAGLGLVPCRICSCDDEQVAEIQIVENLQRQDLSALDEARGYQRLQAEFGQSAEQIASRVGKSRAYVYAKLKLLALGEAGQQALTDGQISESIALLVARIPGETLQTKAIAELTRDDYRRDASTEPMSFRQAKNLIRNSFTTDLRAAIWKLDDDTLVAEAGSCQACPKRSGNNREEYPDVSDERLCMDPTCFVAKREAQLARLTEQAEKKGAVVADKEAQRNLNKYCGGLKYDSAFVELNKKPEGFDQTWSQLAKAHGVDVEREVIVDAVNGKTLLVARGEQLRQALKSKGVVLDSPPGEDGGGLAPSDAYESQQDAHQSANVTIAADAIAELARSPAVWKEVVYHGLGRMHARAQMSVLYMAGRPELVQYAEGWQSGARKIADGVVSGGLEDAIRDALAVLVAAAMWCHTTPVDVSTSGDPDEWWFVSPTFDALLADVGIDAAAERARIAAEKSQAASDPSDAAQAAEVTAEPAAPAKVKRAPSRKAKPVPGAEETQIEVGSADKRKRDRAMEESHG